MLPPVERRRSNEEKPKRKMRNRVRESRVRKKASQTEKKRT
ncbi:hypothetical protein Dimus_039180 [Dionaea muscipula]